MGLLRIGLLGISLFHTGLLRIASLPIASLRIGLLRTGLLRTGSGLPVSLRASSRPARIRSRWRSTSATPGLAAIASLPPTGRPPST